MRAEAGEIADNTAGGVETVRDKTAVEDPESVAEPFVENLEDLEAKVVKRIVKSNCRRC